MHGNPISKRALRLRKTEFSLVDFAEPLYRLALTPFFNLSWKGELPPEEDTDAYVRTFEESLEFDNYQRDAEIAVAV